MVSLLIGKSERFVKMGMFGLFFLAIYLLVFSLSWALVYVAFKRVVKEKISVVKVTVLWLLFYVIVFSVWENGEPFRDAYLTLQNWIDRVGMNILKTLPVLVLFLTFTRKDFLKSVNSAKISDDITLLDGDVVRPPKH